MNKKSTVECIITVILIGLVLASAMCFGTVQASELTSIPKPSVPEFTLKFVDNSYDVPTTYSTDPYTGATVTHSGYHVQNRTVEVNIKNQPFTKYEADGQIIDFYLNIRMKGHYAEDWIDIYSPSRGFLTQSESEYTKIAYSLDDNEFPFWDNFGQSGVVDFQVEALIGSVHRDASTFWAPWVFEGEKSGWSETQTITLPTSTPSPTLTPPSFPTPIPVPGQSFFFVESNSTVSELFFNSTSSELSFTVTGPSRTAGYVKVTIAKSLVSSVQNVKVYFDGDELDVAITSDEDSWLLSFNYLHSTHHVRISLATNAATTTFLGIEYWMWIGVVIIIVVIGAGLLLYFKKRKQS